MATSPRKLATNSKYLQKLDQIVLRLRRDGTQEITKADIDTAAAQVGLSTNSYVIGAIKARMEGGAAAPVQEPKPEDTPQATQEPQDGAQSVGSVNIPPKAQEALQEAIEREQKPVDVWLAHAIEAQNEREKRAAILNRAAAQAKENQWKIKERQKKGSSDQ